MIDLMGCIRTEERLANTCPASEGNVSYQMPLMSSTAYFYEASFEREPFGTLQLVKHSKIAILNRVTTVSSGKDLNEPAADTNSTLLPSRSQDQDDISDGTLGGPVDLDDAIWRAHSSTVALRRHFSYLGVSSRLRVLHHQHMDWIPCTLSNTTDGTIR